MFLIKDNKKFKQKYKICNIMFFKYKKVKIKHCILKYAEYYALMYNHIHLILYI